jgi:hypothetical protein
MIEGLQFSIPQRMLLIRNTLIVGLILSVFLSLNLWAGTRGLPYAGLIDKGSIPAPYDYILVLVLVFLWLGTLFLFKQRLLLFLSVLLSIFLVLVDVNRLQPWFYLYNMMLVVFLFYNGRVDDSSKFTSFFILLQIIFASVYFFSGWSQLNSLFVETDYLELISPLKSLMSERQFLFFQRFGNVVSFIFMFIGIGLIISPIRYLAISLAVLLHLILIVLMFPTPKNLNYSLWFSNLVFIPLLLLLFSGKTKQRYFSPLFLFQMPLFYMVIFLFILMPFFNNSGRWPDYLSSNFKSGNTQTVIISLSEKSVESLPDELKKYCEPQYGFSAFNYDRWYLSNLHVSCYPSPKVFNGIFEHLRQVSTADVKEIELQTKPKQKLLIKQ